jgi:uncharacterized tellurite resistance protein B-like protein
VANHSELRTLINGILANGRVEGNEIEAMRKALYADGKIDDQEADLLVELHKKVERRTPAFEKFFYKAIKDYVLADGKIDAREAAYLRQMLFADGKIDEYEKKLLRELRGEASQASPEFEALCKECLG